MGLLDFDQATSRIAFGLVSAWRKDKTDGLLAIRRQNAARMIGQGNIRCAGTVLRQLPRRPSVT